jgi:hypothetical protein
MTCRRTHLESGQFTSGPGRDELMIGVAQDTVIGMALLRPGRDDGRDRGRAGRGVGLRVRAGAHLDRGAHARHRQQLSS